VSSRSVLFLFILVYTNTNISNLFNKMNIYVRNVYRNIYPTTLCFFFWLDFGLSRLTSLQFFQYHVAGFYKPTIPQSPPSHLRDYSTINNARLEFSTIFVPSFDPNEWCLKNGLHSGGPLGH
jgi:hypothetical protein